MNTDKYRQMLQETLARASAKAAEWEGKEAAMPPEAVSEIKSLIAEAGDLKDKLETAQKASQLNEYLTKGVGPKAAGKVPQSTETPAGTMGFKSLGEQLISVAQAGMPTNAKFDPRLVEFKATGMSEGVPADGGFLVQEDFASGMLQRTYSQGEILSRVTRFPIGANSNRLKVNTVAESSRADGSRWGGILAYWKAEAALKTASKPKFGQLVLELNKLIGLCYVTDELLQDSVALEGIIDWAFQQEFTFQLEDAVINGSGNDQPLGIMNSDALVTVAKDTDQTADTITASNLQKMWSRLWAPSRKNAVWLINQDAEAQLGGVSLGTAGVPAYLPPGGLSGLPYSTLFSRPVLAVEHCQTLGDLGDIMLCDLSQYWMIEKGGIQKASSIHVNFVYDESTYRFVLRTDGQPSWASALTPKNSALTLSPFVTLAARA